MNLKAALEAKRGRTRSQVLRPNRELTIEDGQPDLIDWIQSMNDRDETDGMLNRFSSALAEVVRSLRDRGRKGRGSAPDFDGQQAACAHSVSPIH